MKGLFFCKVAGYRLHLKKTKLHHRSSIRDFAEFYSTLNKLIHGNWSVPKNSCSKNWHNSNERLLRTFLKKLPASQYARQPWKKIHESYMHGSFIRHSLPCIYVITAWMLVAVLNISVTITELNLYVYKTILNLLTIYRAD